MPMFDPCDGGVNARVLILLEAPGPKAVGSQFISRNNPDRTADNINKLLKSAGIPRKDTIIWNIVPWYIGDNKKIRAATKDDVNIALPFLSRLINLLPDLDFIVLMGNPAQSAALEIQRIIDNSKSKKVIFNTAHPSPKVANIYPQKFIETQKVFNDISNHLKTIARNNFSVALTLKDVDDLLVFLQVFRNPKFEIYYIQNNRLKYHPLVESFCNLAAKACWYSEYDPITLGEKLKNDTFLEKVNIDEIKEVLTYFICFERFCDGFQARLISDGHISKLLNRLAQLKPELI